MRLQHLLTLLRTLHVAGFVQQHRAGIVIAVLVIITGLFVAELYVRIHATQHESGQLFFGKYPLRPYVLPLARVRVAADIAVAFPLYILLAQWGKKPTADQAMTIALALLQGFFMAFWVIGGSLT